MNSSLSQKNTLHNNISLKAQQSGLPVNINPFFQYVSNNKLAFQSSPLENRQKQETSNIVNDQITKNDEFLKNKQTAENKFNSKKLSPPSSILKMAQSSKKRSNQNSQINQKKTKQKDARQIRSRSRQKRTDRNRDHSSQSKKQKKDEHFHKTKLCPLYEKSACKKGSDCTYAHGLKELRGLPNFVKTRICKAFQNGECKKSSKECKYAHGQQQLRSLKYDYTIESMDSSRKNKQKERNRRQSQSVSRRQKNNRKNQTHDHSNDKKRNRHHKSQNRDETFESASYLKKIPINKQYERFLYGDTGKKQQFNSSAYLVHNNNYSNNLPSYGEESDPYSINYNYPSSIPPVPPITPNSDLNNYNKLGRDYNFKKQSFSYPFNKQPQMSQKYQIPPSFSKNPYQRQSSYNNLASEEFYYPEQNPYNGATYTNFNKVYGVPNNMNDTSNIAYSSSNFYSKNDYQPYQQFSNKDPYFKDKVKNNTPFSSQRSFDPSQNGLKQYPQVSQSYNSYYKNRGLYPSQNEKLQLPALNSFNEVAYNTKKSVQESFNNFSVPSSNNFSGINQYTPNIYPGFEDNGEIPKYPAFESGGKGNFSSNYSNKFSKR